MRSKLSILFLLITVYAQAQLQRNYVTYNVDNGLAQNTVWDAFQDCKGYMWFGTADGISLFDGYGMKHYKFRLGDSTSINGNTAFKFYEDSEKRLWISHDKGLSIYNRAKDCFINITPNKNQKSTGEKYTTILGEDKRGHIWCISGNNQLMGFNKKDFSLYKTRTISHSQYPISSIRTSIQSGNYIIGYLNDSATTWFRFNTETEQSDIINGPKQFSGYFILYNDSTICTFSKGWCYLYNIKQDSFTRKPLKGKHQPGGLGTATSLTWWQGKIYFGNNTGLYVFNPLTGEFEEHITSFNKTERVSFFYVQFLRVDHSGNLWICTNGAGVKCLSPYQNKFKHYASLESRNSLVKSITTDDEGNIYTGLYAQGFICYTPQGKANQFRFGKKRMELTHVLGMMAWNKHLFMVNDCSLKVFNPTTQKVISETNVFNRYKNEHGRVGAYVAYPFFRTYNQKLFVCCDLSLLEVNSEGKTKEIINVATRDTFICTFEIINDTNWWIGTTRALFQYNPCAKSWKRLPVHVYVKTICHSKHSNEVWVGGNNGLFRLDVSGKILQQYGASDGLPDDFIYGILEDKHGRLWMSHNKGISTYLPETKTFEHYSVKDGLQSNEFNTGAYYKDPQGLLYFGGVNGINVIDPDNIGVNRTPPQIGINEIMIDDIPFESDTAYNEIKTLSLTYLQNTVSFDFSALEYSQPEDNVYRYKMEGFDNSWIESGTKHFARYANLPPGSYTFNIMAANGDGYWNPIPRTLSIEIVPPFWQRVWFYLLVGLLVLAIIGSVFYFLFKRQQAKLKRELEVQNKLEQERLRISRDLHDNVGAQLSFLITNMEWMLHNPDKLDTIQSQGRLQTLSEAGRNAILTLRQTIWAISHTELSVDDFADRFKQYAIKLLEFDPKTTIQFQEVFEGAQILSPAQALNIFRICQEAFNNCLKHAQCSLVCIRFASNEHCLFEFVIEDNGIGFDWEQAKQKGHYGLVNMQARAEEAGALLVVKSDIGKGTMVTITLK